MLFSLIVKVVKINDDGKLVFIYYLGYNEYFYLREVGCFYFE